MTRCPAAAAAPAIAQPARPDQPGSKKNRAAAIFGCNRPDVSPVDISRREANMSEAGKTRGRFMVLLALADGPKHGYEVARHLEERSGGYFSLSFGALYPVLHRLEKEKLVSASWMDAGALRKKKVYALTAKGHAVLNEERADYEAFTLAFARLLGRQA
jgi:PadR family transcriptional regulator PadR